jgi:hypothetical protein
MAGPHDRIVFSLEQQEEVKSALDEEREKHKARWAPRSVLALQGWLHVLQLKGSAQVARLSISICLSFNNLLAAASSSKTC